MKTLVIDYGMSNLGSISRALEECGGEVIVSDEPHDLRLAERIVLPGVGSFADGMRNLTERGWVPCIREEVSGKGIPMLGICLGMQLLADTGSEGGNVEGLGLIAGEVRRLEPRCSFERIPHVGWNEVYQRVRDGIFEGISEGSDFYFVHSYHFIPLKAGDVLATTPYCDSFVSAAASGNVFGVQFHPEKSGKPGFRLLRNFLEWRGGLC